MPKHKTKKALIKRIKITAKGKFKYRHAGKSHLNTGKSRKRKRYLKSTAILPSCEVRRLKHLV